LIILNLLATFFFNFKDDHSRVVISAGNIDYINANYVESKQADRKYILCQVLL
jgi:protein tyrosine phosphatase